MVRVYLPVTYEDERKFTYVPDLSGPGVFLVGPIRGASNWQEEAIHLLDGFEKELGRELWVASPRRKHSDEIKERAIIGPEEFHRQLFWERFHLRKAGYGGCIAAWLPGQTEARPDGGCYARDTRKEIGVWPTRALYDRNVRFVVGALESFEGYEVAIVDMVEDYKEFGRELVVHPTLEEMLRAAIGVIKTR